MLWNLIWKLPESKLKKLLLKTNKNTAEPLQGSKTMNLN